MYEVSSDGLLSLKPLIGPYNTERLISFLDDLRNRLVNAEEKKRGASNPYLHFCTFQFVSIILASSPLLKPRKRVEVEGM